MDEFPLTAWRYHVDLAVEGLDRQNLVDALEAEELGLFQDLPRDEAYRQIREGRLKYGATRDEPAPGFPQDVCRRPVLGRDRLAPPVTEKAP